MRFLAANFSSYLKLAFTMFSHGLIFPPKERVVAAPKQLN
jgi:hypothetical protein